MNRIYRISVFLIIFIVAGCGNKTGIMPPEKGKVLLTVDFQKGRALQYRFVSSRETVVDLNPSQSQLLAGENSAARIVSFEELDMVVTYTPLEINPYGLTIIKADCNTVKVTRDRKEQNDAVKYFAGQTFSFTVDSQGRIHDYSQLEKLIKQTGSKAFASDTSQNRIKEPDMIGDFIATQWFLWDATASIENPSRGVGCGQTWNSKLSVPAPMVSRFARDVTYKLEDTQKTENGNIAIIDSVYKQANAVPKEWPVPYTGRFQMKGVFGMLSGYKLLNLTGSGQELFNIDMGRTEQYNQQYEMDIQASIPLGIGGNPMIHIKQEISMTLIE